jgi:hypothetical protein
MIFELISWIYISVICLLWGNQILKLFFGINEPDTIDFPVVCFLGMSVIGIISFYLSLFIPLHLSVKLALQIPALLILVKAKNRREIFLQLKKPFINFSGLDMVFLTAVLLMILFLCTAPVIHPDTLSYHSFSTQIFDKYGTVPGIANLKPEFGFQSLWFACLAFFDNSIFQSGPWFPLNGCVMAWLVIFLVSKTSLKKSILPGTNLFLSGSWYLLLILFLILSWTQIRLTASSLSPDFIATIAILLGFYFFAGKYESESKENYQLLSVFFSAIAVSIKISAIPILLIPLLIAGYGLLKGKLMIAGKTSILVASVLAPVLIRNIISTGYPFYPSSFAAIYPADWKLEEARVLLFQHYITSYARFPILMVDTVKEYNQSFSVWFPLWSNHLYVADKAIILLTGFGTLLDICLFRILLKNYTGKLMAAYLIAFAGAVFWFVNAPDPRFGTGFLLPLIYFQYAPFIRYIGSGKYLFRVVPWVKNLATACLLLYMGYRAVHFFRPRQLIFPESIQNIYNAQPDCEAKLKKMILENASTSVRLPDSCMFFQFRGISIQQGFKPAP